MKSSFLKQEDILNRLISNLKQLPGIGEKTATRLAFYLLRGSDSFAQSLAESIIEAKTKLKSCIECCDFSESPICPICQDANRSNEIICVVEGPSDLLAFEKCGQFRGKYHVLHGVLSPLDGMHESRLRLEPLHKRLESGQVKEIVLATNPTVEGDTTALYIARTVKYNGIKITRLAHGIPVGAEIEYLDGATLAKAFQNRIAL